MDGVLLELVFIAERTHERHRVIPNTFHPMHRYHRVCDMLFQRDQYDLFSRVGRKFALTRTRTLTHIQHIDMYDY